MAIDGPASTAQCFYCFEVLSANFEGKEPPELSKVSQLYAEYEIAKQAPPGLDVPSVDRSQDRSPASSTTEQSDGSNSGASSAPRSASRSPASLASAAEEAYPVYVTWNTLSRSGGKALRGCIGTFEPMPLSQGLRTYSIVSALEDYRFNPIPASLIPSLGCELTLLSNFEDCGSDALDWEIGKHGLKISFSWRNRRLGATYLPHVCPEQGWTKEECFESLMNKAGWESRSGRGGVKNWLPGSSGKASEDEDAGKKPWETVRHLKVVRYQGAHAAADYNEWRDWRAWASGRI